MGGGFGRHWTISQNIRVSRFANKFSKDRILNKRIAFSLGAAILVDAFPSLADVKAGFLEGALAGPIPEVPGSGVAVKVSSGGYN